jgi:hypothetical protein
MVQEYVLYVLGFLGHVETLLVVRRLVTSGDLPGTRRPARRH